MTDVRFRIVRAVFIAAFAILIPSTAWSQSQENPAGSTVTAGWRDGFFIQNDNGDFRLQIGLFVQADGRFALDDTAEAVTDTFAFRRMRPYLRGRVAQRFEFFVNPDFAGGTLTLYDAYIDTRFSNAFRVRLGKAKSPLGHERLISGSTLLFLERAFPTSIAPNRDLGIQVLGDLDGGVFSYQGGLTNGSQDGGNTDLDTNDGKDLVGRIVVRPWVKNAKSPLNGVGFALSGSTGNQSGVTSLPTFRTTTLQQIFFSYVGATGDGRRNRVSPYAYYYRKGFDGFAEYIRSTIPVREGNLREDIAHQAWQFAGSYVLTGESATEAGVRPNNNFDFGKGHWGAFQIAARYHVLSVDEAAIRLGFATAGSSHEAKAWTGGLNWYLNPYIKYVVNFERTVFDDDSDGQRKAENALAFRMQLYF
jgi:phosphate-selective porin OprO and OprP